jgi:hypothetical protein
MRLLLLFFLCSTICCNNANSERTRITQPQPQSKSQSKSKSPTQPHPNPPTLRLVHVFVALCDNKNQGIIPVPAAIGNGQDPDNNLYWGCDYGIRSFFKKNAGWTMIAKEKNIRPQVLERCIFRHKASGTLLIADAYDGAAIRQCTIDYFSSCAGAFADSARINNKTVYTGGSANLIAYIGHDGLMDFSLDQPFEKQNEAPRQTIALACISQKYFSPHLKATGAQPLLWTTGLMCPEAYTLAAAVEGWVGNESGEQVRQRAAAAYHRYQHCGLKAAKNLLVTGW